MGRAYIRVLLLFVIALTLAGCSAASNLGELARREQRMLSPSPSPTAVATTVPANPTPASTPAASRSAVVAAAATAVPTTAATPTAARLDSTVESAIKTLIERANQEQQDAFAKGDPTIMKDTATSDYYAELVQINQDLSSNGVSAIKLLKLEWGPITLTGATTAQATTYETWRTQYSDGTTDESRDRNVYTLVQENGAWKIKSDEHPDSALDQPPGDTSPGVPGLVPTPPSIVPRRPGQSSNWSGYEATGGTFTGVSGTWTVPRPTTSGSFGSGATWVGIGGVRSRDLIQAGTEETVVGSGQVRYNAWIETLPRPSRTVPLAVSPGDSVSVSITEKATNTWAITIKNNTTGRSYETTVDYASSHSSAEWIEEAPSARRRLLPLEDFGTLQITGGSAIKDGKTVTIAQAGGKPITMVDLQGNVLATPSALTADGAGFSITRAPTTAPATRPNLSPFGRRPFVPGTAPGTL